MSELQVEEIINQPTKEIARWAARINRINYASDENISIHAGGEMADDGIVVWMAAKKAGETTEWRSDPLFEDSILYELNRGVDYQHVTTALEHQIEPDPTKGSEGERTRAMGIIALHEGLRRTGLLEHDAAVKRLVVPLGAMAALCYLRADIRQPIDRELFDRQTEIAASLSKVELASRARGLTYETTAYGSKKKMTVITSVYREVAYPPAPGVLEKLGLNATAELSPWWQELQNDLRRIDAASGSS